MLQHSFHGNIGHIFLHKIEKNELLAFVDYFLRQPSLADFTEKFLGVVDVG